jgi:hypothetical protein
LLRAWFSVPTPQNVLGSFAGAGIVPSSDTRKEQLMTPAGEERTETAQQLLLEETGEDITAVEKESDKDLDLLSDDGGSSFADRAGAADERSDDSSVREEQEIGKTFSQW